MVTELVSVLTNLFLPSITFQQITLYENRDPKDPPLPQKFKPLYDIFCQLPPPPGVILVQSYFQNIISAVDKKEPLPPIPSYAYPNLHSLSDTQPVASTQCLKQKLSSARQEVKPHANGKKQQLAKKTEVSDEDEGHMTNSGAGEQSDKAGKRTFMPLSKQRSRGAAGHDAPMDVDNSSHANTNPSPHTRSKFQGSGLHSVAEVQRPFVDSAAKGLGMHTARETGNMGESGDLSQACDWDR